MFPQFCWEGCGQTPTQVPLLEGPVWGCACSPALQGSASAHLWAQGCGAVAAPWGRALLCTPPCSFPKGRIGAGSSAHTRQSSLEVGVVCVGNNFLMQFGFPPQ